MIEPNKNFLTNLTERMGSKVGDLYTIWHNMYSTESSYRWLEENDYPVEIVLELKYQNELSIYLVEKFVEWYKKQLNEG